MKAPKCLINGTQQAIDIGLNGFAFTLMAESFADKAEKFGGENVAIVARAHSGDPVFLVMTKEQPLYRDFDGPEREKLADAARLAREYLSAEASEAALIVARLDEALAMEPAASAIEGDPLQAQLATMRAALVLLYNASRELRANSIVPDQDKAKFDAVHREAGKRLEI